MKELQCSYCRQEKKGHVWDEVIYPGMKKAIVCALLCTQDLIEYRKVSELSAFILTLKRQ